ncbi:DUF3426 domain-containing protein [Oxalobacteraceae bacterium OM1]|nr:DUF3426 domain-containing protein [Oxalobacteraceae bacterium OM1]
MALATQCPHCHTTFRVAHDQLKLRAGLVRCGACKQIFNGIENLLRPEEMHSAKAASEPAAPIPNTPAAPATPVTQAVPVPAPLPTGDTAAPENAAPAQSSSEPEPLPHEDPLLRMTLLDFTTPGPAPASLPASPSAAAPVDEAAVVETREPDAAPATQAADISTQTVPSEETPASAEGEVPDALDKAMDELQRKPLRRAADEDDEIEADPVEEAERARYEEPSFVRQGRRRQRFGAIIEVAMILGSVILLLALAGQTLYIFRDQIAARFSQMRQPLVNACTRLGCQVALPAQIDAVTIDSNELQSLAPNSNFFALNVLLRNHAATPQAWPSIELTLNDSANKPVARKVFGPRDYLAAADIPKGMPAFGEQTVRLTFELAQLKAAGYRVYLFYP